MERTQPGSSRADPYQVLGVNTGASRREITRAYRRAACDTHPDAKPQDPCAAQRFDALTAAYDLLSDPARRAEYDRQHLRPDTARAPGPASRIPFPGPRLIWAGPVHIGPAAAGPSADPPRGSEAGRSPATRSEDPPVFLGRPAGPLEGWPW